MCRTGVRGSTPRAYGIVRSPDLDLRWLRNNWDSKMPGAADAKYSNGRARPEGRLWRVLIVGLAVYAIFQSGDARALEPDRLISQFHHTAWTPAGGAPANIWAMAQAPDGRLWLGTGGGLYRFDGLVFERIQPSADEQFRSNAITALLALPSGELWIGFTSGDISLLKDGHFVNYTERNGIPGGWVTSMARGPDGAIWAAMQTGLARFAGGRWQTVGADWNYPAGSSDWVFVDSDDTVWVATGSTLVYLRRGSTSFTNTGEELGHWGVLGQAPDGSLWMADERNGTRPFAMGGAVSAQRAPTTIGLPAAKRFMFDSDGTLWATNAGSGGLFRISDLEFLHAPQKSRGQAVTDLYTQATGLTSDVAVPVLEDREGNIWVGTNNGLNRFRYAPIVAERRVPTASYRGFTLSAATGSYMWITTPHLLLRVDAHSVKTILDVPEGILASFGGHDGSIWWATSDRLLHLVRGEILTIALPPVAIKGKDITLAADIDNQPWVSLDDSSAFRFHSGTWVPAAGHAALPPRRALVAVGGEADEVWFGYADSTAAKLTRTETSVYTRSEGLDIGAVWAISVGRQRVLFGGENGLAILEGGRIRSVTSSSNDLFAEVSGVTETPQGDVWLNVQRGLIRFSLVDLLKAFDKPNGPLRFHLFDADDGLPGLGEEGGLGSLVSGSDGRIWLATNGGVAWIDPARELRKDLPSPVVIRSLSSGDQHYSPEGIVRLHERSAEVDINYASVSLSDPGRTQFRYKLDGFDDDWRNVGTRRTAFYTGLTPGTYRFHVAAAGDMYSPFGSDATVSFSIAEAFYQTWWFRVLCAIAAAQVLWLFYRFRLRQMASQIRIRLEERVFERERIARDLHDTLLQGIQGIIVSIHAVSVRLPLRDANRVDLETALDRADEALSEGRDRVNTLRSALEPPTDLVEVLTQAAQDLSAGTGVAAHVAIEGVRRKLNALVREEMYWASREALSNAFQHASASNVRVVLSYGRHKFVVRVRDDGKGLDPQIRDGGGLKGHWGLPGMRERSERMKGRLQIWSRIGVGTEVRISVSGRNAYVLDRPQWPWSLN
jgi:signal transduction histidine kinase/ligand-binding sensor domain-containing protein